MMGSMPAPKGDDPGQGLILTRIGVPTDTIEQIIENKRSRLAKPESLSLSQQRHRGKSPCLGGGIRQFPSLSDWKRVERGIHG
jgi:hypothetical protein